MKASVMKYGHGWVVVLDYGRNGRDAERNGYWVEDSLGGWGHSMRAPLLAVHECASPRVYDTERAAVVVAERAVGEGGEVAVV